MCPLTIRVCCILGSAGISIDLLYFLVSDTNLWVFLAYFLLFFIFILPSYTPWTVISPVYVVYHGDRFTPLFITVINRSTHSLVSMKGILKKVNLILYHVLQNICYSFSFVHYLHFLECMLFAAYLSNVKIWFKIIVLAFLFLYMVPRVLWCLLLCDIRSCRLFISSEMLNIGNSTILSTFHWKVRCQS